MAENVRNDESESESITSSQKSFLKNCPFAVPGAPLTDSDSTEVIGNQISTALVRTPIISFSSPTSLDSINDDVFRTPPENASLSSAAGSEPRVRVSELKPRESSNLRSPSSKSKTTPFSENVRVLETEKPSDTGVVVPLSSPPSVASEDVRVPGKYSPSPTEIRSPMVLDNQPTSKTKTTPFSENVRVLETKGSSDSGVLVPLSSPPSVVRVPAKHPDIDSTSPIAIERTIVLENQPISDSVANSGLSKTSEREDSGGDLPFKEIIEALLRNSGENLNERDEEVSYVEILKKCGLKFP